MNTNDENNDKDVNEDTPIQEDKKSADDLPTIFTYKELMMLPDPEYTWIVEPLLMKNSLCIVSGLPNHMKSFFVQSLAVAVAKGELFLKRFRTRKGKVLIIDREIPPERLKMRWKVLSNSDDLDVDFYNYTQDFVLNQPETGEKLIEFVKKGGYDIVIIDTLGRSHSGVDTSSSGEMKKVFDPLKKLITYTSVIVLHHSNKSAFRNEHPTGEEMLGSVSILAEADNLYTIKKVDESTLHVYNSKSRDSEKLEPFVVTVAKYEDGTLELLYEEELTSKNIKTDEKSEIILRFLSEGSKSKADIVAHCERHSIKLGTVENKLTILRHNGKIRSHNEGKEAIYELQETSEPLPDSQVPSVQEMGDIKSTSTQDDIFTFSSYREFSDEDLVIISHTLRYELAEMEEGDFKAEMHRMLLETREEGKRRGIFVTMFEVDNELELLETKGEK